MSGDITAADVLSQGSCDLLSEIGWELQHLRSLSFGRAPQERTVKRQAVCGEPTHRTRVWKREVGLDAKQGDLACLGLLLIACRDDTLLPMCPERT